VQFPREAFALWLTGLPSAARLANAESNLRSLLSALEEAETSAIHSSSSTAADGTAAEKTGDVSDEEKPAHEAQLGELHQDVIALVRSMVTTAFHCLAEVTKPNESFWDANIDLIHT
jgi:hypothetical protein